MESTGNVVTLKDLHNADQRTKPHSQDNNLPALLSEMQKEPGAVTEVVVTGDNSLRAIYYQDAQMMKIQRSFSEILLLDATYKLNDL